MNRRRITAQLVSKPKAPEDRFAHLGAEERRALKELAEVERAIAILEGRSDAAAEDIAFARKEAERLRRAVDTALERIDQNIREARRARLRRALALAIGLGALAGAAFVVIPQVQTWITGRTQASEAAQRAAAPFVREGFAEIDTSAGAASLTVTGERGRCYVGVAGSGAGSARVRVEQGPLSAEGSSVGACACTHDPLRFTPSGPEPLEVRVLAAPVSVAGGGDLLNLLPTPPEAHLVEGDRGCAEEAIDAFIAAHPPSGGGEPRETRVEALGLRRVAAAQPGTPLVVLPAEKETCFLAQSEADSDALSLRLPGGERPIQGARSPVALCGRALAGVSVWREGKGEVSVFSAPAQRVGGLIGLGELAARAGRAAALWAPPADLAFDAAAALVAGGLAPLGPDEPAVGASNDALIVAVSTDERSLLDVDERAPDALCRPPVHIGVARALCLETRPGALGDPAKLPPGSARAKRPFWLPIARGDRAQNERALDVLALARRMSALGFELTSLTGFVEVPGGVEVIGRSGESEIVALTVSRTPPYLHPLTDGPAWTVEGEPQITQLPAGKSARLRAIPPHVGPRGGRETIVWRR
jgi:hypothetical protein